MPNSLFSAILDAAYTIFCRTFKIDEHKLHEPFSIASQLWKSHEIENSFVATFQGKCGLDLLKKPHNEQQLSFNKCHHISELMNKILHPVHLNCICLSGCNRLSFLAECFSLNSSSVFWLRTSWLEELDFLVLGLFKFYVNCLTVSIIFSLWLAADNIRIQLLVNISRNHKICCNNVNTSSTDLSAFMKNLCTVYH